MLNIAFVIVEAVYGVLSGSMALLADAGHNLSDVLGLIVAWTAATLAKRKVRGRFTYGFRSSSILAALFNAIILLMAVGAIAVEAIRRFFEPAAVAGTTVIVVAAIGVAINTATALMFMSGRKGDLNIRGAYLHMAADAAVSAGVVVAGFIMMRTGWLWLDPAVSLAIAAIIAIGTWGLLRDSVAMSLHAAPPGIDPEAVERLLRDLPGVRAIHDLHIWPMSTTETALTVHLVMPDGHPGDGAIRAMTDDINDRFGIGHCTIQVEIDLDTSCALASSHVV